MKELALKIPTYGTIDAPSGIPNPANATSGIEKIIQFGVTTLMVVSTILALLFLIYGGIKWITSGGDKAGVETARKTITYAIIGLVIILASFLILNFISNVFGVKYLPTPPPSHDL